MNCRIRDEKYGSGKDGPDPDRNTDPGSNLPRDWQITVVLGWARTQTATLQLGA